MLRSVLTEMHKTYLVINFLLVAIRNRVSQCMGARVHGVLDHRFNGIEEGITKEYKREG